MTNEQLFEENLIEVLAEFQEQDIIQVTLVFTKEMWDYNLVDYEPDFSEFTFNKMSKRIQDIIEATNQDLCDNTSEKFWFWVKTQEYNDLNFTDDHYDNMRYQIVRDYYLEVK